MRRAILYVSLLLCILCAAAQAERTIYLAELDTQITLPDGVYALWADMDSGEESLSWLGMTKRQAVSWLQQEGLALQVYTDDGPEYSLAEMAYSGSDFAAISDRELQTMISGIRSSYSRSGSTLSDPGLYRTEHGMVLRYEVQNAAENWSMLEYIYTRDGKALSLQALLQGKGLTSAQRQQSDRIAMSVWPNSGEPRAAAASAGELTDVSFAGGALSVSLPEDYTAFTREEILSDASVNAEVRGMVEADEKIAGGAFSPDANCEIWILTGEAELYDASDLTEQQKESVLANMGAQLASSVLDPDGSARTADTLSSGVYRTDDADWRISYEHWATAAYDEYALFYAGISRGREAGILFVRYNGEITREDLNLMNAVAQTVSFGETAKKAGRKTAYTEPATGLRLTLPQRWTKNSVQSGLRFALDGAVIVCTTADIVPSDAAAPRSAFDTLYYSRRDIAEMYGTTFDQIGSETIGGRLWYRARTVAQRTAYGVRIDVPETDILTVKDGTMVLVGYIGQEEAPAYEDFEKMTEGLEF